MNLKEVEQPNIRDSIFGMTPMLLLQEMKQRPNSKRQRSLGDSLELGITAEIAVGNANCLVNGNS